MRLLSLAVVGAAHANKRGPTRIFELALCAPGEPVELVPEPKNPADPRAIAVHSCRGVQLGYVRAERAALVGGWLRGGREVNAIFQASASFGGWIRVALDGEMPTLPPASPQPDAEAGENEDRFWPDEIYPDD